MYFQVLVFLIISSLIHAIPINPQIGKVSQTPRFPAETAEIEWVIETSYTPVEVMEPTIFPSQVPSVSPKWTTSVTLTLAPNISVTTTPSPSLLPSSPQPAFSYVSRTAMGTDPTLIPMTTSEVDWLIEVSYEPVPVSKSKISTTPLISSKLALSGTPTPSIASTPVPSYMTTVTTSSTSSPTWSPTPSWSSTSSSSQSPSGSSSLSWSPTPSSSQSPSWNSNPSWSPHPPMTTTMKATETPSQSSSAAPTSSWAPTPTSSSMQSVSASFTPTPSISMTTYSAMSTMTMEIDEAETTKEPWMTMDTEMNPSPSYMLTPYESIAADPSPSYMLTPSGSMDHTAPLTAMPMFSPSMETSSSPETPELMKGPPVPNTLMSCRCLEADGECSTSIASKSLFCDANTPRVLQTRTCRWTCCLLCMVHNEAQPCQNEAVRGICAQLW